MDASPTVGSVGGVFAVLPTPFDETMRLDLTGLSRVTERLAATGLDGLMVLGSGGENAYLSSDERVEVVRCVLGRLPDAVSSIVGIVTFSTADAVLEAKRHRDLGARALLVGLPQYYPTPLDQVIAHYEAITQAVDIPVLYYNYPSTMHMRLSPEAMGELFARVALAGIKESGLSTPELVAHRRSIARPVSLMSGQCFSLRRALQEGAAGAICPVPMILPRTALELMRAHRAGDDGACGAAQQRLLEALPLVSAVRAPLWIAQRALPAAIEYGIPLPEGSSLPHAGIKEALRVVGLIDHAGVRPPQTPLSPAQRAAVQHIAETRAEL